MQNDVLVAAESSVILVVDDDALINMSTVDMVQDLGHTALEAYSGQEALQILNSGRHVDVLITDYSMPGMTGVELADQAKQLHPHLLVLLASGYSELPSGIETDLPRLSKPFQQSDLSEQITQLLGARA